MSRVLLLCPEPLAHRHPAGVGIRFLEMARTLDAAGHVVTLLTPDGAAVPRCDSRPISPKNIRDASEQSDVAVLQGHVANEFFAHALRIPTVVDLYDPFIVENFHYWERAGSEVYRHDHATLLASLRGGDFFLCASRPQRFFYLGLLLAVGRLDPETFASDPALDSLLAVAPFGVPPRRTTPAAGGNGHEILFGGIYDWYDPLLAIDAVATARREAGELRLVFTRHPNAAITPQTKAAEAERYVRRNGYESFVSFEPWFAYEEREDFYDRFTLALLTFPRSLETDLAMRTRIFDYLWGGLPVVTSSAVGTDELLREYEAGTVVESNRAEEVAEEIVRIVKDETLRAQMVDGAGRYVDDHQWSRTLAPLVAFCASPRLQAQADPAVDLPAPRLRPPTLFDKVKRRIGGLR